MKGVLSFVDHAPNSVPYVVVWGAQGAGHSEVAEAIVRRATCSTGRSGASSTMNSLGVASGYKVEFEGHSRCLLLEGSWPMRELKAMLSAVRPVALVCVMNLCDASTMEPGKAVAEMCQTLKMKTLVVLTNVVQLADHEFHSSEVRRAFPSTASASALVRIVEVDLASRWLEDSLKLLNATSALVPNSLSQVNS